MQKLKKPATLNTAFSIYTIDEILGEGGAGRVYGGISADNTPVAIKVLAYENASTDKKRRFKNEINFLMHNRHNNIVTVIDYGIANTDKITGAFYVMHRYHGSLRSLMHSKISQDKVLPIFSKILDGVEAAHLQNVVHRDLKPENILYEGLVE